VTIKGFSVSNRELSIFHLALTILLAINIEFIGSRICRNENVRRYKQAGKTAINTFLKQLSIKSAALFLSLTKKMIVQ